MKKLSVATLVTAALVVAPATIAQAQTKPSESIAVSTDVSFSAEAVAASAEFEEFVERAEPFVNLVNGTFVLDEASAIKSLSDADITRVKALIVDTNSKITKLSRSEAASVQTVAPGAGPGLNASAAAYKEGINKIEAHWYGFRVWLSKSTLQGIGAGVSIGGIWIPEPIVSKVLATAGVVVALAPGGVVFNWTPVAVPGFPAGATWGFEWQ